jgi:2'-5' RNA ligase
MRLFFAYWPSSEKAQEMAIWVDRAQALCGGRPMRTDTLHMTLAFLGMADAEKARDLAHACRQWRLPTGSMVLNEPGRFRNAKVVWLGPSQPDSPALSWLYDANEQLWDALSSFGWPRQDSRYRPHISLLRNAGPAELDDLRGPAIPWTPERCVLVASEPTEGRSRYTVLAEVPLEAPRG